MINSPQIVLAGIRGAEGKKGESAEIIEAIAGEDISAFRAVYLKEGKAYKLSNDDSENIFFLAGISTSSAIENNCFHLKQIGRLTDNSFNFDRGRVYLGGRGELTQVVPEQGYSVLLGVAVSKNEILLNIDDPIKL
ncbi:hypothetical protein DKL61_09130 [Gammaproteobacteria bacterium ESL0073]|nr:hypothetical protein DKL61_09130 [Gammaproteobacteria bacterium ESL0073]